MPIPQTPRHDFLHELHKLLRPAMYLEIGVQTGRSLAQAIPPTFAIGVDPEPCVSVPIPVAHQIFPMTSDRFFEELHASPGAKIGLTPLDLAFIDGMHLVEYALRDFIGVERHARPDERTVVVFDDVLPYSADIAGRTPLSGDWTGDVWKIDDILRMARPDLTRIMVDVNPTGVLVVLGLDPTNTALAEQYAHVELLYATEFVDVAQSSTFHRKYVGRAGAVPPAEALDMIRRHLNIHHEGV